VAVFEDVLANLRSSASHAIRALEAVTDAPTARSAAAR
jgi:hypothetical protein